MREFGIADLGFLQAEDVGRFLDEEFLDDPHAGADRIDVPGRDLEGGGHVAGLNAEGGKWKAPAPGAWSEGHQALLREVNYAVWFGQQGENSNRDRQLQWCF